MASSPTLGKFGPLTEFVAGLLADVHAQLFRDRGLKWYDNCENAIALRIDIFVMYLNQCWKSLILRDIPKYYEPFDRIHQDFLPNESPPCLFFRMFQIGTSLLRSVKIEDPTAPNPPPNSESLKILKEMLMAMYVPLVITNFNSMYQEDHQCSNPLRYQDMSKQNPDQPLYTAK